MPEMDIIFLDIDGVLNCRASFTRRNKLVAEGLLSQEEFDWPSNPYVKYLNQILKATQAKIVISSTWRLFHPLEGRDETKSPRFREGLRDIFKKQGIEGEIIGITPNSKFSGHRGADIKAWLDVHPEVRKYVILDDSSDMLEEQLPYFVKTSWEKGLEKNHVEQAINILTR